MTSLASQTSSDPNSLLGIPTCLFGVATWFLLANDPESAWYLTPEEKKLMIVRRERQVGHTASSEEFHKEDFKLAIKDWKIWMFALGQFGSIAMLYGYSVFLPTIIKGIHHLFRASVS